MLLQEIFNQENKGIERHFHIEIDGNSNGVEYSTPPEELKEISFLIKLSEDGTLDDDLLDIIVSYKLTKVNVTLEVPLSLFKDDLVKVSYLINITHNLDIALSLLPNGHRLSGEGTIDDYRKVLKSVVLELTKKPNFSKFIYPVSGYFQYLMMEVIIGKEKLKNLIPDDLYVVENFYNVLSTADSDSFKEDIREDIYDFYGGESEFKLVAGTMIKTVYEKNKESYTEMIQKNIEQQKAEYLANNPGANIDGEKSE